MIHTPLPPSALARAQLSSMREIGREPGYARERPERPQARGARAIQTLSAILLTHRIRP